MNILKNIFRYLGRKFLACTLSVAVVVGIYLFASEGTNFGRFCDFVEYVLSAFLFGNVASKFAAKKVLNGTPT